MILIPILVIGVIVVTIACISEWSSWAVVGDVINEEVLDAFFEHKLADYKASHSGEDIIFGPTHLPFISKSVSSFRSKWYISDYGRISRWSKWSKEMDTIYSQTQKAKPTLLDLVNK